MPESNSDFITLADAAMRLGIHANSLRRWIAAGELAAYRVGPRLVRVKAADVEALIRPVPTASAR